MRQSVRRVLLTAFCGLLAGCGGESYKESATMPVDTPSPVLPVPTPPVVTTPFQQVQAIIAQRCVTCHSVTPTTAGFSVAPRGIRFDTPEQIRADARRIYYNVVTTEFMPYGNRTNMTPEERVVIGKWFENGAL